MLLRQAPSAKLEVWGWLIAGPDNMRACVVPVARLISTGIAQMMVYQSARGCCFGSSLPPALLSYWFTNPHGAVVLDLSCHQHCSASGLPIHMRLLC
eukprot:250955-Chlamydomonas_euryale.AAC.5